MAMDCHFMNSPSVSVCSVVLLPFGLSVGPSVWQWIPSFIEMMSQTANQHIRRRCRHRPRIVVAYGQVLRVYHQAPQRQSHRSAMPARLRHAHSSTGPETPKPVGCKRPQKAAGAEARASRARACSRLSSVLRARRALRRVRPVVATPHLGRGARARHPTAAVRTLGGTFPRLAPPTAACCVCPRIGGGIWFLQARIQPAGRGARDGIRRTPAPHFANLRPLAPAPTLRFGWLALVGAPEIGPVAKG